MNGNETKKELLENLKQAYQDASKYDEQKMSVRLYKSVLQEMQMQKIKLPQQTEL